MVVDDLHHHSGFGFLNQYVGDFVAYLIVGEDVILQ